MGKGETGENILPELLHGREECFEVEDNGAAQREAAEGLPIDAEVDTGEWELGFRELGFAEFLVGVAGGHEERGVDLEAPGAALNGAGGGEFGEVAGREMCQWYLLMKCCAWG